MSELFGFVLLYAIPGVLAYLFWLSPWMVRRLALIWDTRNFMDSVRANPKHVHHTERVTGIVKK